MLTNLLKGYSEDEIKAKLLHKSHEDMFNDISEMNMEGNVSIEEMNELKSYKYDSDVIIFEIIAANWDDSPNLEYYIISKLSEYSITSAILKLIDEYQGDKYDADYKVEQREMLDEFLGEIKNATYDDINELIEDGGEYPMNIYYKKNNITKTLDYGDKILDCLK